MKPVLLLTGCASCRALVALCLVLWEVVEVGRSAAFLFSGAACSCEASFPSCGAGDAGICRCGVNGSTRPCHGCRAGSSPVICSEFIEMRSGPVTSYIGFMYFTGLRLFSLCLFPWSCRVLVTGLFPGDANGLAGGLQSHCHWGSNPPSGADCPWSSTVE